MKELEKISHETMVFMRWKYRLDEIGDGKNEFKFKQGQKTIQKRTMMVNGCTLM